MAPAAAVSSYKTPVNTNAWRISSESSMICAICVEIQHTCVPGATNLTSTAAAPDSHRDTSVLVDLTAISPPHKEQHRMSFSIVRTGVATLLLALPCAASLAHTSVTTTNPTSGSVLEQSPPIIEIQFREEARITSVVVVEPGKAARKLAYEPNGAATLFKIPDPSLGPGRSEIQWKALSKDGHVVSGTLVLVVKPSLAKTH
jgi:copper resistance protein C